MKKVILIAGIVTLALGACTSTKHTISNDDVYANPKEEKLERERFAAEQKKKQEEADRKKQEELAAQKAKEESNPAYKEPVYSNDDYYDYAYASRLRRFNNAPVGLGYYDNWYTNYYWYNNNPSMYGVSIYSSYNYWGGGYGYNHYDPYQSYNNGYWNGYNQGYNNGYFNGAYGNPYGYGYNPYAYGYNPYGYNPYGYNPYNCGGWGYYNSYDNNSSYKLATYAPRGSHDGGNSARTSFPNKEADGYASKYIQSVNAAQETTPKFTEVRKVHSKSGSNIDHSGSVQMQDNSGNTGRPVYSNTNEGGFNTHHPKTTEVNSNGNAEINTNPQPQVIHPKQNPKQNLENSEPVKINPPQNNPPKANVFESNNYNTINTGNNPPSNQTPSGNSPAPRNGGNVGSSPRPR
jgi:hypothetical protein